MRLIEKYQQKKEQYENTRKYAVDIKDNTRISELIILLDEIINDLRTPEIQKELKAIEEKRKVHEEIKQRQKELDKIYNSIREIINK